MPEDGYVAIITDATITMLNTPALAPVKIQAAPAPGVVAFSCSRFLEYVGDITFSDEKHRPGITWQVGFVQAEYIETNWGFYRGFRQTDGSVFVQRGRPPARPRQACNDSLFPGSPFSMTGNPHPFQTPSTGGPPLPLIGSSTPNSPGNTIRIFGFDGPDDSYDLTRTNATAKNAINTLFEAQLEFLFCTALIGRSSAGDLRFLKHFYWNVRWQTQLNPAPIAGGIPTPNPPGKGNGTNVGPIIDGEPTDGRFLPLLKYPQSTNCNTLAGNAGAAILKPGSPNVRERSDWSLVDVRR